MGLLPVDDRFASYTFQRATSAKNDYAEEALTWANLTAITGDLQNISGSWKAQQFGTFTGEVWKFYFETGDLVEGDQLTVGSLRAEVTSVKDWGTHKEATLKEVVR